MRNNVRWEYWISVDIIHVARASFSHAGHILAQKTNISDRMTSRDLTIRMIFLSQTAFGILGNFSLLCHYLSFHFTGCRVRSTDLILKHLTIANLLVILSKGIPQTMAALGVEDFLNDTGCKLVFYVHRVSRDCPLAPHASWTSSRQLRSAPGPAGVQSWQ